MRLPNGSTVKTPFVPSADSEEAAQLLKRIQREYPQATLTSLSGDFSTSDTAPLVLRETQVRLPNGSTVKTPFVPSADSEEAAQLLKRIQREYPQATLTSLSGDFSTSDTAPLVLRETQVRLPNGSVERFPWVQSQDRAAVANMLSELSSICNHKVTRDSVLGDFSTADSKPLLLQPEAAPDFAR